MFCLVCRSSFSQSFIGSNCFSYSLRCLLVMVAPPKDNYLEGLDPLVAAGYAGRFTLVDLRALRAVVFTQARTLHPALVRTVFGFDALLVMSGSTPSADFSAE